MEDFTAQHRHFLEHHSADIKAELLNVRAYQPVERDIIIVVHDQLECIKDCISSIARCTRGIFHIYLWDNGSQPETAEYLSGLIGPNSPLANVHLHRSEENTGFLLPNNRLVSWGRSPYIILLNSDTIVRPGWDETMIAWLQTHPDIAAVGCLGGLLDENMIGTASYAGYDIDYLCGYCLCFSRELYRQFGLFDEQHLDFAYGEDSDFSLRLKEAGKKVYAMFCDLVLHLGARTSLQVATERDMTQTFQRNHEYLLSRWKSYTRILSKANPPAKG